MSERNPQQPSARPMLNEQAGGPWGGGSGGGPGGGDGSGDGGGKGPGDGGSGGGLGPRNPWSQPPRGRQPGRPGINPSAIEELVRRLRERFGGGGPRGGGGVGGGSSLWLYGVLGFICLWIVLTSFHRVEPQNRGVVTRLGSYAGILRPGVNFTWPAPIDVVTTINVDNIRTIDIPAGEGENLVLTGDQNIVDLDYSVRWNIRDPELYLFELRDPDDTIQEVAESAMREAIARVTLNDAIGPQRAEIEDRVAERMEQILDSYHAGVTVQGVAIKQADPPAQVNDAFKAVSAAQQEAQSALNNARTYAQQMQAKAQGEAAAFDRVYSQYRLAPVVTRRRMYYETMEDVLAHVDKTIVETPGVTPYLPLPPVVSRKPQ